MMQVSRAGVADPVRPVGIYFFLLSILAGLLFLVLVQLPIKWFLTLFAGILFLIISASVTDKKKFYLFFLISALPIALTKTFLFTKSDIFRSTFGYTVYASMVPLFALYFIWIYRRVFSGMSSPFNLKGLAPFALLFLMVGISTMLARSVWSTFDLFELACSVLLFFYVANQIRDFSELRFISVLLILLGTFEGSIAIGQYVTGSNLGFGFAGTTEFLSGYVGLMEISRVMGTVGHPNSLAQLFDMLIPFTFAFLLFYPMPTWKKVLTAFAVLIQYIGLSLTYSRGGITCCTLGMSFILFVYLKRKAGAFRGLVTLLSIWTIFAAFILIVPNPIQKGLFRTEGAESAAGRVPLNKVALEVIKSHPLFGLGPNTYVEKVGAYDNTPQQLNRAWNTPVHNLFLLIAGETGIPALVFFLCLVWVVLSPMVGVMGDDRPILLCTALGILIGILAFLSHCMVDLTLWTHPRLHWFILALGIAVWRLARPSEIEPSLLWKRPAAAMTGINP